MRVAAATLLARRMISCWLLLGCVFLTAIVTASVLAALADFGTQALPQAVHRRLAADPALSVAVIGLGDARQASTDTLAIGTAMRTVFGVVPVRLDESVWSDPLRLPAAVPGLGDRQAGVAAPADLRRHAALVSGSWPAAPLQGEPLAAAFPAQLAAGLHLARGTVITLRDLNTRKPVTLRVSGTYRQRNPASPYWNIDNIWTCGATSQDCFTSHGPIVVSQAAFGRGELAVAQASWVALPVAARIGVGDLGSLAGRIDRAQARLQHKAALGGLVVSTGMPRALRTAAHSLAAARSLLIIGGLQLLLVGAVALALTARLLASHRDQESALLRGRGAARWQLAVAALAEALLVGAAASAAGALAGGRLAQSLAHGWLLRGTGLRATGVSPAAWYSAALVFALCLAVLLGPALWPPSAGATRARHSGRVRVATAVRAGADVALLALALLAVWQLRGYSPLAGGTGIDPVLAITPALALAAVSLVALRLLPAAARLLDRAAARGRRAGVTLASWEISRRPLRQAGTVLLAVLAVATAVLAITQYQSWRRSASDRAAFAVGADVRVEPLAPVPPGRTATIARARGVLSAMPVGTGSTGAGGQALALDARQALTTVLLRPDLSALPPAMLWQRITPSGPAPGLRLPGRPDRIAVTASLTASRGVRLAATAVVSVQDRFGTVFQVPAGSLRADGHEHALVAVLSSTGQAAYPLRLLGLSLSYPLPPAGPAHAGAPRAGRPAAATLTVHGIALAATAQGAFAAPFATGRSLAGWRPGATGPGSTSGNPSAFRTDVPPMIRGWRAAAGGSRAMSFDIGIDLQPPLSGFPAGQVTLTAPIPGRLVPGIATSAFLRASGTHVGGTVPVTFGPSSVPVRIVAEVKRFPTVTGPTGALIVDQAAIQDILASRWDEPLPVSDWWLRTAGGAVPPGLPAGAVVTDRARQAAELLSDPLAATPQQGVLGIAVAAALLAALGFAVGVAARLRAGRLEGALLTALGMSRAAQVTRLCGEELMMSVPAAAAGLAAGAGIARLLIPAVIPAPPAAPPVLVTAPLVWLVWLALAVAAIPVLVMAASAGRRADPAGQLRTVVAP